MKTISYVLKCTCCIFIAMVILLGLLAPKNANRVAKDTNSSGSVAETSNAAIAKCVGGKATITLPDNQKLQFVTWKDADSLWILYRPMRAGEQAETYTYQEDSKLGILEANIIIREVKR